MNRTVALLATAILAAAACGGAAEPSPSPAATRTFAPVTLKVGQVGGVSDAAIFIADAKGFFKEQGIIIDSLPFSSAAQMVAPLGIGELLVGGGASGAGLFNAIDRGIGLRLVADKGNLNPGHGFEAHVVRAELAEKIKGPQDLKGRTIAVSARDITPEVTLDAYLRKGGLTIKDVNVVVVPHADMLAALRNGSIDVGLPIEPHVARIVEAGVGKVLVRDDAVTPGHQTAVMLFSEKIAEQRDVGVRFMVAYLKGARFYADAFEKNDAARRREAVDILAKATRTEPALFEKMVMPGIDPNGNVNVDSLNEIQQWLVQKGTQKNAIDMKKAVDLSYVQEALKILGQYK